MSGKSNIAWTNMTWNPVRGCERVSPGCMKCYAEVMAARHSYPARDGKPAGWGEGFAKWVIRPDGTSEARWTGLVKPLPEKLGDPLRWRVPCRVFVNSTSDLFHKDVPDEFIDTVFAVMALTSRHTYQILTKRADRMLAYLTAPDRAHAIGCGEMLLAARVKSMKLYDGDYHGPTHRRLPLRNVWLGVSAEDQATFEARVEILGQVPAAVRFVSAEPLLGDIDCGNALDDPPDGSPYGRVNWVIVGGESGQDYRLMDIDAARWLIEQCKTSRTPVFVKQDNGPRPGLQGRFTDAEFALKEYPA